jgi:putative ABC transport system permease protein
LLLSGIALYGLLAYRVSRRLHEIGVRMALGASVANVASGVLKGGLALVGIGLAVAIPLAVLAGRYVEGMLFSVSATDPVTYIGVAAFLVAVAGVACVVPARRAANVDPAEAFRAE